jgi:hypothetical protein
VATPTPKDTRPRAKRASWQSDAPIPNLWHGLHSATPYGQERFMVAAVRGSDRDVVSLDRFVESLSWTDESALWTGSLQTHEPGMGRRLDLQIADRVVLLAQRAPGQAFLRQWEMMVDAPNRTYGEGTVTWALANDLINLQRSEDDFKYRKSKARPKGWPVRDAILDVCRRFKVDVAYIAPTRHRVTAMTRLQTSPLEVISDLLTRERENVGTRLIGYFVGGRLVIRGLVRNPNLMTLSRGLIEAALASQRRDDYGTVLTVRATGEKVTRKDAKGHKKTSHRKISVVVSVPETVKRWGAVHRIVFSNDADTDAEAREAGLHHLWKVMRPQQTLTLTHAGILGLRRGDYVRVVIPEGDLDVLVFVKTVNHTLAGGSYQQEITVGFDDPLLRPADTDTVTETKQAPKKTTPKTDQRKDAATAKPPPGPDPGEDLYRRAGGTSWGAAADSHHHGDA